MVTHEEVGTRIKQARTERGWRQEELGKRLARPRSHAAVSDIERGKTKLNIEELAEFAQLFGKPLDYFTQPSDAATRGGSAVVYRRSERTASAGEEQEATRAIDAFKQVARQRAERKPSGA